MKRDSATPAAPLSAETRPGAVRPIHDVELFGTVFSSGAAVMTIEIIGTRVIGPVFGVSLFVWSALLTVTLASLALGYYAGGVVGDRWPLASALRALVLGSGLLIESVPIASRVVLGLGQGLGPRAGPLFSAALLFTPSLVVLGMVAQVAVRLAVRDVDSIGRRIGTVYAVSTGGSLFGTLLTAFVLVPSFETGAILNGVGSVLIAIGVLPLARRRPLALLALVVLPPVAAILPRPKLPPGVEILDRSQSLHGLVEAIDDRSRGVRLLRVDHSIVGAQSKADGTASFGFIHVLEAVRFFHPRARTLLQLGLGIGSLPVALEPYGIVSDVVEIDPVIARFAARYFGYSSRGSLFVEDARTLLFRTRRKYDIVVHDTFTGGTSPEHLLSLELLSRIKQILRPEGVLALNFVGRAQGSDTAAMQALLRTLRALFSEVRVFSDGPPAELGSGVTNLLFFASSRPLRWAIPDDARFENAACEHILRALASWEIHPNAAPGPLVTDAWNPLARLQLSVAEEHFAAMNELLPRSVWLQ